MAEIRRFTRKKVPNPQGSFAPHYEWIERIKHVPDWNVVKFPHGDVIYSTTEKANNARIIMRAIFNVREKHKEEMGKNETGWAFTGKLIGYHRIKTGTRRQQRSMGNASHPLYKDALCGRLPESKEVREKLFALAGYPWD
jgi:hypothetical protein